MPKGKGVNSKVAAANEKKAAFQAQKDSEKAAEQEAKAAADWRKGANNRGDARAEASALKADETARKKREKEALLRAEEEANAGIKKVKPKAGAAKGGGKKKKGKGDDLSFLEDSLVGAADKKAKAAKKAERLKKEREAAAFRAAAQASLEKDPNSLTGDGIIDVTDVIGSGDNLVANQNIPIDESGSDVTGIDAGLSVFKFAGEEADAHPEKRAKALHKAFEGRMMPQMKEDFPGLKVNTGGARWVEPVPILMAPLGDGGTLGVDGRKMRAFPCLFDFDRFYLCSVLYLTKHVPLTRFHLLPVLP